MSKLLQAKVESEDMTIVPLKACNIRVCGTDLSGVDVHRVLQTFFRFVRGDERPLSI